MEQTLTLTKEPLKTARLARKADLTVAAKGVLTNETTQTYLSMDTDQQVHAFILEGVGAVQRWLDMIGTEDATNNFGILYFSQDITKAEQDLEWCKPLLQPSCTSSTTSSTSSIPIKKTVRKNVSATKNGRNTTSVQKAAVQKETDTTKSRIATAVPKKIPKPATNTTTRTSTKQPTKAPVKAPVTKAPVTRTRKPDTGATPSIKSSATKKIPTSKAAGVTKSTPPVAVTGRTRKVSRVDKKDAAPEKKKVASKKPEVSRVNKVEETEPSEQDITPPPEVQNELKEEEKVEEIPQEQVEEALMPPTEPVEEDLMPPTEPVEEGLMPPTEAVEEKTVDDRLSKVDEGVVLEDLKTERIIEHSISHVSSGSSATTDEHDAEVAAAVMTSRKSSGTPSYFDRAQRFSPPRPETPEVDQLRQRFETIIQTPTTKTPSAKISPEFVARIKEMKPKGPAGSRVKSMVELFMDENLNKWEF